MVFFDRLDLLDCLGLFLFPNFSGASITRLFLDFKSRTFQELQFPDFSGVSISRLPGFQFPDFSCECQEDKTRSVKQFGVARPLLCKKPVLFKPGVVLGGGRPGARSVSNGPFRSRPALWSTLGGGCTKPKSNPSVLNRTHVGFGVMAPEPGR